MNMSTSYIRTSLFADTLSYCGTHLSHKMQYNCGKTVVDVDFVCDVARLAGNAIMQVYNAESEVRQPHNSICAYTPLEYRISN
jgi:hypothetical protein